jgi:predicted transcriptional regulator
LIPTVYDICIQNVLTIDVQKTLDDAIKKMSDYNLRTIILKNYEDKSYHILTTTHLLEFKISNIDKSAILQDLNIPKVKELDKDINLLSVLNDIDASDEYMVITENEKLIGIVSYTDIVNNIDPQIMMKKQTLSSLTHQYRAITTDENASTLQVIHLLKESSRDAVIIIDTDLKPIGIFTTKDFIDIVHNDFDLLKPI